MVYGYCRVSTHMQARDGNSLEVQEKSVALKQGVTLADLTQNIRQTGKRYMQSGKQSR